MVFLSSERYHFNDIHNVIGYRLAHCVRNELVCGI